MPDGVQIRTDQVTDFATGIRADAADGFRSAASRAAALHHHGVVFATAIPGDATLLAKQRYAQVLENTEANLREFRRAAALFAEAAEQIAQGFATADLTTDQAQKQIESLLAHHETLPPLHEGQQ
ncbi:hypothetical protein GCM10010435_36480 [Winogradskya consettensis]|uniref:Uncharacterized protein n=1 Tax=Winogradskya consettensis TaxID=113560 RepID=A0A919VY07_9ACTN|nr:hypothetical protein [Actinoplanes consettensis]GIM81676.1 hypothetical protein Aco04nite_77770 [Actinoplanes consettensis]